MGRTARIAVAFGCVTIAHSQTIPISEPGCIRELFRTACTYWPPPNNGCPVFVTANSDCPDVRPGPTGRSSSTQFLATCGYLIFYGENCGQTYSFAGTSICERASGDFCPGQGPLS